MGIGDLFLLAVGLSMDALAVAICKGLSVRRLKLKHALTVGLYFGGFQAGMPLIGYFLGKQFESYITSIDHWIAFVLLTIIGINMIRESCSCAEELNDSFSPRAMLPMAVATSIDALAIGVTFAFLKVNIGAAVSFIGIITFLLSAVGVYLGNIFGAKYKSKAELVGGIVLIFMGAKILVEHLGLWEKLLSLF
ncbi:MAG: manganese efflux pump [Ruminococcaceae bacterium]|nr:manganese efflux pump [Oscillospiraceae bacterium]